jgi:flavorubredoxin
MDATYTAAGDIRVMPYFEPSGPMGFLPLNAFLIHGPEPIMVETGIHTQAERLLESLRAEIDPAELRWILVSHEDADHAGGLEALMREAPNARVVLSMLTILKLGRPDLTTPDRIMIATPGESFVAGDRRFGVMRPPLFDSSATVGYFDEKTRCLFSADSFGGLVPAPTRDIEAMGPDYVPGSTLFLSANSAWVRDVQPARFAGAVDAVRALDPDWIMPVHGAPMKGMTEQLCDHLLTLPGMEPVVFPNDAGFREMLRQMDSGMAA